jgi:uncharacterized protein YmfQ (DUF2313 family)
MSDKHIRRDGDDYGTELMLLLPSGQAWPKDPGSTLDLVIRGLAFYYGVVDGRAADLLEIESDPTQTTGASLLPDWERNWALPDACEVHPPTDDQGRRDELMFKMTLLGRPDRQFFIDWAARRGETITIREYAPYMCGISRVGETRVITTAQNRTPISQHKSAALSAPPVSPPPPVLSLSASPPMVEGFVISPGAASGHGVAMGIPSGVRISAGAAVGTSYATSKPSNVAGDVMYDQYYRWQLGPTGLRYYWLVDLEHTLTGIECLFRRYKPGHTHVVFTYRSQLDRAISLYPWLGV